MTERPYLSIAFTNRNDGYGGDLERRVERFIEYYGWYARHYPGLLEFVICDWNPPGDRAPLREAFDWSVCGDVTHVVVPPELHLARYGAKARKMLDYIGRNVALRRGAGEFSLVVNQDIFASDSIMRQIASRTLSRRHFYRADRCDFNFEPCRHIDIGAFETTAQANVFSVHRRHNSANAPISVDVTPDTLTKLGSGLELGDILDPVGYVGYCRGATLLRQNDRLREAQPLPLDADCMDQSAWRAAYHSDAYQRGLYLHTNASGDFILAPRAAFDEIHGMPETTDFYMHLDSYAIMQLFAAGYEQAIYMQPHRVFHADHDRSARADVHESMTWVEHERELSRIVRGDRSYRFNGPDWGLGDETLPTWRNGARIK